MGLTTVKEELTQLVATTSPDILVLTETKLTERSSTQMLAAPPLERIFAALSAPPCINAILSRLERETGEL